MRLSVHSYGAGITGSCPACQVIIQAPQPRAAIVPPQYYQPLQYQQPQPYQQPHDYQPNDYQPNPRREAPDYYAPPRPQPHFQRKTPRQPQGEQTYLRPSPRQLPGPAEANHTPARVRLDPSGEVRSRDEASSARQQRPSRSGIFRAMLPLVFVFLVLGVIFGVKKFLQTDRSAAASTASSTGGKPNTSTVERILPPETFEGLTGEDAVNLPVGTDSGMSATGLNTVSSTVNSGIAALELLEKFLEMKSLEERLPYIESRLEKDVLASSPLNGQLPEVLKTTVDVIERDIDSLEEIVDHYYQVEFAENNGGANQQTMLVRTRGNGEPKVVVDPFLDLFGGRFEKFAAEPTKEAGTFQVIISAGGMCYADIPDADKKLTMKILAQENGKEIGRAYFGKQSLIGRMLDDETSGLGYGEVKPCTVFMRWNMDDDPERPFLEALDIKELNWNP